MKTFALSLLALFALLFALGLGVGIPIGERAVFRPPQIDPRGESPEGLSIPSEADIARNFDVGIAHTRLDLAGTPIALTYARHYETRPGAPLLVSCSGNASDRANSGASYLAKLLPFGDAVIFDYPGYGDSGGAATVAEFTAFADAFSDWLDQKSENSQLILWGHSLGGFVCAELAARSERVDAIILETTAANIKDVARAWRPRWLPVRFRPSPALRRFDIPRALQGFAGPVLVIGAARDEVLPVSLHRDLADSLPSATYVEVPDAYHHNAGTSGAAQAAVADLVGNLP